ncbi:MAG: FHA domain-containing protein [Candidatus Promineifilaceae bacterium]
MAETPERLIVASGPNQGQEYELGAGEFTIGRSTNNQIVLPLPEISRRHARIWKARDGYYVEDLGSTNGTFVNELRIQEATRLQEGDLLQIGDSFRLFFTAEAGGLPDDLQIGNVAPPHLAQPAVEEVVVVRPSPEPAVSMPAAEEPAADLPVPELLAAQETAVSGRRYVLTCGCVTLLLIAACFGTLYFLDAYQGGRLLYCGSLNPFFEFTLGPLGFNPVCP